MPTSFPGADDVFTEPDAPASTALDDPGTGTREHTEHHEDAGDALQAMQAEATLLIHSHDGSTARHGSKLAQANTHQSADTDSGTTSLHHTLGTGANQAAAGSHTHTQATSHSSPDTDSATSALHHTIGTGANQGAAGNHTHGHPITLYIKASTTFTKASYPGLYAIEVEIVGGGGGSAYCAATSTSQYCWGMGGSGGGYGRALILASTLSSSETITIGAGGTGGTSGTKPGGTGGTTSFGSGPIFYVTGGVGGTNASVVSYSATTYIAQDAFGGGTVSAGPGYSSSVYDISLRGISGGAVELEDDAFFYSGALDGQPSAGPYGVLTKSLYMLNYSSVAGNGTAGQGYGSGASGPFNIQSNSARNGSAGSAGLCVIRLIF